jgi:uncharacterized protein YecE (DUF72 family)
MIRVGTAGWSVRAGHAHVFPPAGTHLERYAARFNAVEINSSFYRPHRVSTYERWAAGVPQGFRFAVKAPKAITHEHRLLECDSLMQRFASEVAGLGHRLGVILVQLPPSLPFGAGIAGPFFELLHHRIGTAIACEPRHPSWFTGEADALLVALGVARVAADPPPAPHADKPNGCGALVYYRLHGAPRMYWSSYGDAAIAAVHAALADHEARDAATWCIFDNTAAGHATPNALHLAALQASANQPCFFPPAATG